MMASGKSTSWQIDREATETMRDLIFFWLQNHCRWYCSHEIKKNTCSLDTNYDSILKSRDITLPTKVGLVKAMVFPVIIYGCESWTIKKAVVVQSLSCMWLFATPWIGAHQVSLSFTISYGPIKEGWAPKNRCFWTVVLEKTLDSPLDFKEIKSVNP